MRSCSRLPGAPRPRPVAGRPGQPLVASSAGLLAAAGLLLVGGPAAGCGLAAVATAPVSAPAGAAAQQPEQPWRASAELSLVQTGGNAESSTIGVAGTFIRSWARTELRVEAGSIRTRTTSRKRSAVGAADDYRVETASDTRISAENYRARLTLDRSFSDRAAVFFRSEWVRNTFSGIDGRIVNGGGVSNRWIDDERQRLDTRYALTHTTQYDVVPVAGGPDRFFGLQVSAEYRRQLGKAEWTSALVVDENGKELADLRADWTNSATVALSGRLALKATLRLMFDNEPSLLEIPLRSAAGEALGAVRVSRERLDRVTTIAVVVTL